MNNKELGEIRRRQKRERSTMRNIYGCYVNDNKEIISQFSRSFAMMSENEADKYFGLLRRVLGGASSDKLGKNLHEITFRTSQVADSAEHKLLMDLRGDGMENAETREAFFQKVIEGLDLQINYLILLGTETYDVPFKSKDDTIQADNSADCFTYILCAVCPVKLSKPVLHYEPESKDFQDGNMANVAAAPELGFLFPAFDGRTTNIYNALFYNRSKADNREAFVATIFNTVTPEAPDMQKASFTELLETALEEECDILVAQSIHDEICQQIQLYKESKVAEPLALSKGQFEGILEMCGVSEAHLATFSQKYEATFGEDAQICPETLVNRNKIEITTEHATIRVAGDRSDLIQTKVIGGTKYILIQADDSVQINGININIPESTTKETFNE